jgi:glycosyltransferase involved in cell wall biosynthesis
MGLFLDNRSKETMKISFVIPAYNEEHYIADCLDSVFAQSKNASCDTEIIVVNNGSTDKTAEIVARYPGARLVHEPQKGIVWARRAGLCAATGDLIANVDADTRLTPKWIEKIVAEFKKDDTLVGLSGPFHYYDLPRKTKFLVDLFYCLAFSSYLINRYLFRKGSVLQGGNFVVRRDAFEKIGGYDTTIDFYGEDTDVARRISKAGKVKFTYNLPIYASGRRLTKEGVLRTGWRYTINYFWVMITKRPFTKKYTDVRPAHETQKNS